MEKYSFNYSMYNLQCWILNTRRYYCTSNVFEYQCLILRRHIGIEKYCSHVNFLCILQLSKTMCQLSCGGVSQSVVTSVLKNIVVT
jgi:hypothetical protein